MYFPFTLQIFLLTGLRASLLLVPFYRRVGTAPLRSVPLGVCRRIIFFAYRLLSSGDLMFSFFSWAFLYRDRPLSILARCSACFFLAPPPVEDALRVVRVRAGGGGFPPFFQSSHVF